MILLNLSVKGVREHLSVPVLSINATGSAMILEFEDDEASDLFTQQLTGVPFHYMNGRRTLINIQSLYIIEFSSSHMADNRPIDRKKIRNSVPPPFPLFMQRGRHG